MKWKPYLLTLASTSLFPLAASGAETAQARLYCLSVALHQGTDAYGDIISVNSGPTEGADELIQVARNPEITFPDIEAYVANMGIYDNTYSYWSYGTLNLNIPPFTDTNGNKFPDFFEVSQRVAAVATSGSYSFFDSMVGQVSGTINATWNRSANSKNGICSINLNDPYYDRPFIHSFEILEYTGTLSFTPGSNVVSGTLNLTQTGSPTNTFQGSIQFVKSPGDRFNTLTNLAGTFTDASQQLHYFTNHLFLRDANWPTNYAGYIEFYNNTDPTQFQAWGLWVLSITDMNDANKNGIPDFSDDPQSGTPPPRPPQLSLAPGANNLMLTIHGDVGHVHQIQQVSSLTSGSWQTTASLTLTNDPVVVPLPFSGAASFWRVIAQ